jgi:hypothetical protein
MGSNKKKQYQLARMFHRQNGRCAWCGGKMLPPGTHKGKGVVPPTLCTFDHLDDRHSDERGKHGGEYRNCAACWTCNNRRNNMQMANVPREVLWEKSGSPPNGVRDDLRRRKNRGGLPPYPVVEAAP